MKSKQIVLVLACALALLGCSKEDKERVLKEEYLQEALNKSLGHVRSSREIAYEWVDSSGIEQRMRKRGFKADVAVGTAAECELKDVKMVTEAIRQRIFRTAFEAALAEIAASSCTEVVDEKKTRVAQQLRGVSVLYFVETYNIAEETYDLSVVVVRSEELSHLATDICDGKSIPCGKPGRQSLAAWVKSVENVEILLGGKWFVDDVGDRWIVGMVTKDGSMSSYLSQWVKDSKEARLFVGEEFGTSDKEDYLLKMYALNWASRMVSDDVSVLRELGGGDGFDDDFREEIKVNATFPLLQENDRVKWFERKFVSPFSQKEIEVLIAAVRCNDIAIGRKEYVDRRSAGLKKD